MVTGAVSIAFGLTVSIFLPLRMVHASQWDPQRQAVDRCEQELTFRMGNETRARDPDANLDYRSLTVQDGGRNQMTVSGRGAFRRDKFDRGRDYSFDCTFDVRAGSARASYRWSGGFGGDYETPGYPQPPSYRPPSRPGGPTYPPSSRVFYSGGIINRASGKGLDVENRGTGDAANIQQWDFGNNPNQVWDVVDQGAGRFSIINQGSNKALDVANHSAADGANVQQFRFANGDNQLWRLERVGGGYYHIVSVSSGKCLDADQGRINENGANVQQWTCNAGALNQQWRFGNR